MKFARYLEISKSLLDKVDLRQKHFSFIIRKSKILSIGWNSGQPHPKAFELKYKYGCVHSELSAILKGRANDYCGCEMLNIRVNIFDEIGHSKPCNTCQNVLKMFGFSKCWYSTPESFNFIKL